MLNSPAAPSNILSTSASSAATLPPSRPGRLRGLSYLRNYTHLHSSSSSRVNAPPLTRSHTSPAPTASGTTPPTTTTTKERSAPSPQRSNTSTGNPTSGWVPSVGGQSGILPTATAPKESNLTGGSDTESTGTRNRSQTVGGHASNSMLDSTGETNGAGSSDEERKSKMPAIRLIPHHDPRSSRPSLSFPIHNRTLPAKDAVIRVGRYSERDQAGADGESTNLIPIGFKSKVVSRRHCELWCSNDQWYIKDVKSSSGTFLNHVRLSSANTESKPYPVNDGDVVQLGIDFKGGEEMIFRCVKIRVECNRSWQKALNEFNTSTHKQLRDLASASRGKAADTGSTNSSECAICLNRVAPCQALFVAPCSHVWHYKCVQKLLFSQYPSFQCPNCRAYADLEADVDDIQESESDSELEAALRASEEPATSGGAAMSLDNSTASHIQSASARRSLNRQSESDADDELSSAMAATNIRPPRSRSHSQQSQAHVSATQPMAIPAPATPRPTDITMPPELLGAVSATPTSSIPFALATDPLSTPRNDEGPFVLDSGIDDVIHRSRRVPSRTVVAENE